MEYKASYRALLRSCTKIFKRLEQCTSIDEVHDYVKNNYYHLHMLNEIENSIDAIEKTRNHR